MLRWLTAGESHGPALVAVLEGLPAHVRVATADVQAALARRRLGFGRGARMKFEADEVRMVGGVRHGRTQGGPVAIEVGNTEWPKWEQVMAADPVDADVLDGVGEHGERAVVVGVELAVGPGARVRPRGGAGRGWGRREKRVVEAIGATRGGQVRTFGLWVRV